MLGEFVPTTRDETFHTVCLTFARPLAKASFLRLAH